MFWKRNTLFDVFSGSRLLSNFIGNGRAKVLILYKLLVWTQFETEHYYHEIDVMNTEVWEKKLAISRNVLRITPTGETALLIQIG